MGNVFYSPPPATVFKVGDTVRRVRGGDFQGSLSGIVLHQGDEAVVIRVADNGVDLDGYSNPKKESSQGGDFSDINFELVKRGNTMLNDMKNYFGKNKDVFFTLGAVLILDYFLFQGAMRKKIQDVVEKMLNNVDKKVSE